MRRQKWYSGAVDAAEAINVRVVRDKLPPASTAIADKMTCVVVICALKVAAGALRAQCDGVALQSPSRQ